MSLPPPPPSSSNNRNHDQLKCPPLDQFYTPSLSPIQNTDYHSPPLQRNINVPLISKNLLKLQVQTQQPLSATNPFISNPINSPDILDEDLPKTPRPSSAPPDLIQDFFTTKLGNSFSLDSSAGHPLPIGNSITTNTVPANTLTRKKYPNVTVVSYLTALIYGNDEHTSVRLKSQRVFNFLLVPVELEKTLWLGYIICLDAFLSIFTILPIRVLLTIIQYVRKLFCYTVNLNEQHVVDVWKIMILVISCAMLYQIDPSWLYHAIRGQSFIKLYVIFNLLEVFDRLFSSFGIDLLDSLFARSSSHVPLSQKSLSAPVHFLMASIYADTVLKDLTHFRFGFVAVHSIVMYYQMVTLNVSINSNSNGLYPLLLSNQFVELKSNVFKRYNAQNLFQLTCADMTERLNLSVFLILNAIRNFIELLNNTDESIEFSISLPYISSIPPLAQLKLPVLILSGYNHVSATTSFANFVATTSDLISRNCTSTNIVKSVKSVINVIAADMTVVWSGLNLGLYTVTPKIPGWVNVALEVIAPALVMGLSEVVVDWLKHAFITKFNNLNPRILYSHYRKSLCADLVLGVHQVTNEPGQSTLPLSSPNPTSQLGQSPRQAHHAKVSPEHLLGSRPSSRTRTYSFRQPVGATSGPLRSRPRTPCRQPSNPVGLDNSTVPKSSPYTNITPATTTTTHSYTPVRDMVGQVSRRVGFSALPLVVVTIRMVLDIAEAVSVACGFSWSELPADVRLKRGTTSAVVLKVVSCLPSYMLVNTEALKRGTDFVDTYLVIFVYAGFLFVSLLSFKLLLGVTILDQCLYKQEQWSKLSIHESSKSTGDKVSTPETPFSGLDELAQVDRFSIIKRTMP